jgi:DoxX-like protein
MSLYVVAIVITAVATLAVAIPDFIPAGFVLANSAKVHVPPSWLPMLGTLKIVGAIGLLVGVAGAPAIGIAAATGLVLFFIGAVIAHIRAHVLYNIAFPGAYLTLSAASLVLLAGK